MPIDLDRTPNGSKYSEPSPKLGTIGGIDYSNLEGIDKFRNDPNFSKLNYSIFKNNEYIYEDRQSTSEYWKNTFAKFLHPATTSFTESFRLDKTLKEIVNPGSLANDDDLKEYIKKSNELQSLYPIYENPYTKDGFKGYFSRGASSKWSSIVENSGFMIGTGAAGILQSIALSLITPEFGGSGGVVGLANTVKNVSEVSRLSSLARAYRQVNSLMKAVSPGYKSILGVGEALKAKTVAGVISGGIKFAGNATIRFQQASTEAMMEAIEGSEHFKEQQIENFKRQNGRNPDKNEIEEIETYAAELFNSRYLTNVAALSVTNLLQDFTLFNTFKALDKVNKLEGLAKSASKRVIYDKVKGAYIDISERTLKEKAKQYATEGVKYFGKNIFSEGLEESIQYAIDKGTFDYYDKKYNKGSYDFLDSVKKGISSSFNDKEGKEAFWSGVIMSGVFSGTSSTVKSIYSKYKGIDKKTKELADEFTEELNIQENKLKDLLEVETILSPEVENAAFTHASSEKMQEAAEKKDNKAVIKIKDSVLVNAVKTAVDSGKYDIFIENKENLKNLSDIEFRKQFNIDENTDFNKDEVINDIISRAKKIKQNIDIINSNYENPYSNYRQIDPIKKPIERAEAFKKYKAHEEAKLILIENRDSLERINKDSIKNREWFYQKNINIDEIFPYIVSVQIKNEEGKVLDEAQLFRQSKIKTLKQAIKVSKDTLKYMDDSQLGAEDVKRKTEESIKNLQEELKILTKLEKNPSSIDTWIELIENQQKKNPIKVKTSDHVYTKKELKDQISTAVSLIKESETSLAAINFLENDKNFEKLTEHFSKLYDERYEEVTKDVKEKRNEKTPSEKSDSEIKQKDKNETIEDDDYDNFKKTSFVPIEILTRIAEKHKAKIKGSKIELTKREKEINNAKSVEIEDLLDSLIKQEEEKQKEEERLKKELEEKDTNLKQKVVDLLKQVENLQKEKTELSKSLKNDPLNNTIKDKITAINLELANLQTELQNLYKSNEEAKKIMEDYWEDGEEDNTKKENNQATTSDEEIDKQTEQAYNSLNWPLGSVFRTTAEELREGVTTKDVDKLWQAAVKSNIFSELTEDKNLSDLGYYITLQRNDKSLPQIDNYLERVTEDLWPIVAIVTDKDGNPLLFNEKGKKVKKGGRPLILQTYETRGDSYTAKNPFLNTEGRIEERTYKRLGITKETFLSYSKEEQEELKNSVRKEFEIFGQIKNHIRDNNTKVVLKNNYMSKGFLDSEYQYINVKDLSKKEEKVIELPKADFINIEHAGKNYQQQVKKGYAYIKHSVGNTVIYLPLLMPKLDTKKELVEKLIEAVKPIMSKQRKDRTREDNEKIHEVEKYLKAIIYIGPRGAKAIKYKNTKEGESFFEIIMHENQTDSNIFDINLKINISNELLEKGNEKFVEFYLDESKNIRKKITTYNDFIKNMARVKIEKENVSKHPLNIVISFDEQELLSKVFEKTNEIKEKIEEDPFLISLGPEYGMGFENEDEKEKLAEEEITENIEGNIEGNEDMNFDLNAEDIFGPSGTEPVFRSKLFSKEDISAPNTDINRLLDILIEDGRITKICNN